MKMKTLILILFACTALFAGCEKTDSRGIENTRTAMDKPNAKNTAVFAGGCYWCMDASFEKLDGLKDVISGHAVGNSGSFNTGKVEAIKVVFDPAVISYSELLEYYWKQFDPTDDGGSFHDRGDEYKSYIYYLDNDQKNLAEKSKEHLQKSGIFNKPIVTKIVKFDKFIPVRESEQHFYKKNPERYYSYREASGRDAFIEKTWGKLFTQKYSKPSDEILKKKLSPLEYDVTQKAATEQPFNNPYWDNHKEGIYVDIVSGEPLYSSKDKFKSGTGWPSFVKPIDPRFLHKKVDSSLGMERVEVVSKSAGSHLGHVFDDGPQPTNLRYCMDSAAMRFIPKEDLEKEGYGNLAYLFK
jgi:peptide methionine sulfoxide reductase msrA/msrB